MPGSESGSDWWQTGKHAAPWPESEDCELHRRDLDVSRLGHNNKFLAQTNKSAHGAKPSNHFHLTQTLDVSC